MTLLAENSHRARAKILVSLFPGIHLRELQRSLGTSFSTTRYHVDHLSKTGAIQRVEDGGYSRLYPAGLTEEHRRLFSILRSSSKRAVLRTLAEKPGTTQKDLCSWTGLAKSTVSETLSTLLQAQIVESTSNAMGSMVYSLRDRDTVSRFLASTDSVLGRAADRFIDLWDF